MVQVLDANINTTNNKINNFGILVTTKNKQRGKKRKMPKEIIDNIFINGLQSYGKYEKLNPLEISIKSNTVITDLNWYKNYKYHVLMNSLYLVQALQIGLT